MAESTVGEEKAALLSSLKGQREHVLGILQGLPDDALRRPVLPSGWNCLGLVRHLALDVERFWFRDVFAGEIVDDSSESAEDAWKVAPDVLGDAVFELYRQEVERADSVIAGAGLDAAPSNWPEERWPDWRFRDLRTMMLHVITETACHAGHLDAVRELLDGRTWLVVTE